MADYNRDGLTDAQRKDLSNLDRSFKFALECGNGEKKGQISPVTDIVGIRLAQGFLDGNDERLTSEGADLNKIKTDLFNAGLIMGIFLAEVGRAKVLLAE